MSFLRVTEPNVQAVSIPDLGISIAQNATVTLSNQFSVNDLYLSADLEALIINGDLEVEIDYGNGFSAILAVDYTNRDALGAFLNIYEITNKNTNEQLVNGSDVTTGLHNHNSQYYTETELGNNAPGTPGASLIGVDDTNFNVIPTPITTLQQFADAVDDYLATSITLDTAYDNDSDGILDVDGVSKDLNFRSNNSNDILISRTDLTDTQEALLFDVSANELILGDSAAGALAQILVRVKTNLQVDGDITFNGTITDTTVNELNVTNANINLRDGAVIDADASITVDRPVAGINASLLWNETTDRWQAGVEGSENTIGLLELDEVVTGVWEFKGGAAAEPNMYLTNKASAPTTSLGTATQIPLAMVNNVPGYYDKTRTKWLSVFRDNVVFSGRNNNNNKYEYARIGEFTSNQAGYRLLNQKTLIGVTVQLRSASTFTLEVRTNGNTTPVYSLPVSATDNASTSSVNVDFAAGDEIQVYLNGSAIDRPLISLIFAQRL